MNIQPMNMDLFTLDNCEVVSRDEEGFELITYPGRAALVLSDVPGKLGGVDWQQAKYLVFDVLVHEEWSVGLNLGFWEENNLAEMPNLLFVIGVLPRVKTTIAIPLSELNSQKMFQGRTPGRLKTVLHGNKVDLAAVNKIWIGVQLSSFTQKLAISNLHLSEEEPEYPIPDVKLVDEFGQWTQKEWPGKIHSEAELLSQLQPLVADEHESEFPADWNTYGGWTGKKFEATGYFRTQKDGDKWWLVDPEGNVFYSNGLDCVRPEEGCPVDGIEKLFTWLPEQEGLYQEAWRKSNWFQPSSSINFAAVNLIRAFGENWWEAWSKLTRNWMIDWGFNTVGNWSSEHFSLHAKLPYVWPLADFPQTSSLIFRDFPDVFSDEYQDNANKFALQLERFKDDPYLIGYFLRNEPEWAFVDGLIIAEELLENERDFASKEQLIAFLKQQYNGEVSQLNHAWNTTFSGFDQLRGGVKKAAGFTEQARLDLKAFSREMVAKYVSIPSKAAKAVDPHHLNLGMRYAYLTDEDLLSGSENFDVFSINCYKFDPTPEIEVVGRLTGLPVMIGEYHFGALDKGLTATGLKGVTSQTERGKAYSLYTEKAAASPYCVGAHYFILSDQAALGRFDGENYQIGLVNVCHQPYQDMLQYVAETNRTIYQVASGEKEPFNEQPEKIEFIAF